MSETGRTVMVAVPALDEQETVGEVIRGIREVLPAARIVVVDDGSADDTAAVADSNGADVLRLPFNVGVGAAMRTAFLFAVEEGMDSVVQVDADGQHNPRDIPVLLSALEGASVVVGSRFADGGSYPVRGPRRWAMRLLAGVLSRVTHTRLTDTTSGFRAADRRAMGLFARHYPTEYLGDTVESLVIAARAGLDVREVPVTMRPRQHGESSAGTLRATAYLARALLALTIAVLGTRRDVRSEPAT